MPWLVPAAVKSETAMKQDTILRMCVGVVCLLCGGTVAGAAEPAPTAAIRFNRDIRPILSDNCFACHGPDEDDRGGDLRLDVRDDAIADRGGSAAIVPGKPDESEILRRILSHDADEVMPPPRAKKTPLTAGQIETIRRWIGGCHLPETLGLRADRASRSAGCRQREVEPKPDRRVHRRPAPC